MKRIDFNNNWIFSQASKEDWLKAQVPGNVHLDLLNNNRIPDPYYRLNEQEQQWIGEADWVYKTQFIADTELLENEHIDIVFEGLDTYADVYINGKLILETDNMYCGWRTDAKPVIKKGINELKIYFHSVIKETLPLFENNGFEYGANNSQPEPKLSIYTRKPGYHYGWDWGPRLLTCGVWRPVYLEAWKNVRLESVRFVQGTLNDDLAELTLKVEIISEVDTIIEYYLSDSKNSFNACNKQEKILKGKFVLNIDFEIEDPKLWWCNGLGEQYLYELALKIKHNGKEIEVWNEKIGLRTLKLVHEEDKYGKSFNFRLNGIPVFIKGSNCLPADYFLPRVTKEDYRKLLNNAVETNMNMLRLWGGAVYEEKDFYNLCDEMGILVWQDFMFACAMYPADEVMQKRIKKEAEYNIKRIRNHACLALWCGNNEIDEGWHQWGWQEIFNYSEETSEKIWDYYCKIFYDILPEAVKKYDPERPYWPSSPKYGFKDSKSRVDGDMHYWGVWFLNHPKEKFKEYLPRFMSEYGLQSMPEIETFRQFSLPGDWNIRSDVMKAHQRQYPNLKKGQTLGGYDMMMKYVENEFHIPEDFEKLAYVTQLLQAEYLKYAIETHRRNMPYCMGTMYWQFNDLWPVTSWSTIDYYGRWKAANYFVRKAYKPAIISVDEEVGKYKVYIVSDLPDDKEMLLKLKLMNFNGDIVSENRIEVKAKANKSTLVYAINGSKLTGKYDINELVWVTRLYNREKQVSENIFYFCSTNKLKLEETEIKYGIKKRDDVYHIKLKSSKLAKNVKINTPDTFGKFTDNYFDLLPGEEKLVLFSPDGEWDGKLNFIHYYLIKQDV